MTIMVGFKRQKLTLVQATELMAISCRQARRVRRRYQTAGDAEGLEHRLRGRPTTLFAAETRARKLRQHVLARYDERAGGNNGAAGR
jgi:hypothetical protein